MAERISGKGTGDAGEHYAKRVCLELFSTRTGMDVAFARGAVDEVRSLLAGWPVDIMDELCNPYPRGRD